ncbi:hypothetical protein PAXRUDRAFT_304835 [Paxillus rubicundulus Ve08.2h10]|uniref:Uncharacterized protein n=1 Tax=Paxillus rubicundulus Ve08.2h10 TaxID=930991 RepID=A0A0D0E035_9AGAM|nr:hypothetical protein PAXRUDRAFT_304835 [Paxillus rubicundulus Ve08.2h10]
MCAVVEPRWLQYECGHFSIRDNLPWWMDYCMYEYCVHSPLHETPCRNCEETCEQQMLTSPNIIMSGGINLCRSCELHRLRAMSQRRRRRREVGTGQ